MKKQVASKISELKKNHHLVIVSFHWGIENEFQPHETQKTFGRLAVDAGADLVLGHHPHVLQPIEIYKGKHIVYSLGNFVFGGNTRPWYTDTMIFQITFNFIEDELQSATSKVIPASVTSDPTKNNYRPQLLYGKDAERILRQVGK